MWLCAVVELAAPVLSGIVPANGHGCCSENTSSLRYCCSTAVGSVSRLYARFSVCTEIFSSTRLSVDVASDRQCGDAGSVHGGHSEIIVRLGDNSTGMQTMRSTEFNHISVGEEDFKVDFGSTILVCTHV